MVDKRESDTPVTGTPDLLGLRLRGEREAKGISLRELARRIGVSPSLVSQIETGKVHPSVSTLYSLATELATSVDHLLFDGNDAQTIGGFQLSQHPNLPPVLRSEDRKTIQLDSGVRWERLTAESVPGFDFLFVVYPPGSESASVEGMQRHSGREWGYVISGHLHVTIAFDDHVLGPGDSIAFDSTTPHRLWNESGEDVQAVWFVLGRQSGHS